MRNYVQPCFIVFRLLVKSKPKITFSYFLSTTWTRSSNFEIDVKKIVGSFLDGNDRETSSIWRQNLAGRLAEWPRIFGTFSRNFLEIASCDSKCFNRFWFGCHKEVNPIMFETKFLDFWHHISSQQMPGFQWSLDSVGKTKNEINFWTKNYLTGHFSL